MRQRNERLNDILAAALKIEEAHAKGFDAFDQDEFVQVFIVHHIMIIGEAVRSIDPAFKAKHPEIPWREIGAMRNIIVHDYFRINKKVVWETAERDIPILKRQIDELLGQESA